jgi:hypothetical protein
VDSLEFDAPKTKQLVELLGNLGAEGKVLLLTDGVKENVYLSSRNLPGAVVRPFGEESAYDILWANIIVIEKTALESAEPSESHKAAMESRSRGEPAVRALERAAEEERAERRKARPGHGTKSRVVTAVKAAAPVQPEKKAATKPKAKAEAKVEPKAEQKAEAKAEPKAKAAPKKKPSPKAGSDVDLATVELPKVGELVKFLAKFDDAKDIEALMKRDSRKTAQAHYKARLTELSGAAKGKKD